MTEPELRAEVFDYTNLFPGEYSVESLADELGVEPRHIEQCLGSLRTMLLIRDPAECEGRLRPSPAGKKQWSRIERVRARTK